MVFSYYIAPRGGRDRQALVHGNLYIGDVERAKRHVQTVVVPNVQGKSDLEAVLRDAAGAEIWRGPYLGQPCAA